MFIIVKGKQTWKLSGSLISNLNLVISLHATGIGSTWLPGVADCLVYNVLSPYLYNILSDNEFKYLYIRFQV